MSAAANCLGYSGARGRDAHCFVVRPRSLPSCLCLKVMVETTVRICAKMTERGGQSLARTVAPLSGLPSPSTRGVTRTLHSGADSERTLRLHSGGRWQLGFRREFQHRRPWIRILRRSACRPSAVCPSEAFGQCRCRRADVGLRPRRRRHRSDWTSWFRQRDEPRPQLAFGRPSLSCGMSSSSSASELPAG